MVGPPEIFGSSIVCVGSFNPAIFSPDWCVSVGLLGEADAEAAKSNENFVVSRQATLFNTDWFAIQALENQLVLTSAGALSPAFKDLAQGLLTTLPHVPVSAVGLNFMAHFRMMSIADFHKVGDALAPKQFWRSLFDPAKYRPGMQHLAMRFQNPDESARTQDELRITVEASAKIANGIYMMFNDHHEAFAKETSATKSTAERAAEIVSTEWEKDWEEANRVFASLLNQVLQGGPT